ncbi:hypothetical protein FB45DRAFT_903606 [Roridomyces roridus]|uniref:Uncharacterized protein n=1 Tax=Roridomyces roridus TaxID=1738132 RepID=A0AAD7C449_9AGAR|nr:hypothetical protein FB45DRAFT_903606 [Roridomyces roridus]
MQQPASFFRSWRKKATQSPRSPNPSDSPSAPRFFRKGSYAESDAAGLPRATSPPGQPGPPPPLTSSHSLDRPLPAVPPSRPPRPPSLDLEFIDLTVPPTPSPKPRSRTPRKPSVTSVTKREMPELDHVWEDFMKDVQDEDIIGAPPSRHGVHVILDPPRPTLYRAWGSESSPYLTSSSAQTSDSESDTGTDPENTLALFPIPPPLPTRRRMAPKPLVLLPTPTIAPLPPSPSYSSRDSTPLATPTTPRYADSGSGVRPTSFSKKPGSTLTLRSPPDTPTTPTTPTLSPAAEKRPNAPVAQPHRLRSAQSVPHIHWAASDSNGRLSARRQRVGSLVAKFASLIHSFKHQLNAQSLSTSNNVQWGYAI